MRSRPEAFGLQDAPALRNIIHLIFMQDASLGGRVVVALRKRHRGVRRVRGDAPAAHRRHVKAPLTVTFADRKDAEEGFRAGRGARGLGHENRLGRALDRERSNDRRLLVSHHGQIVHYSGQSVHWFCARFAAMCFSGRSNLSGHWQDGRCSQECEKKQVQAGGAVVHPGRAAA